MDMDRFMDRLLADAKAAGMDAAEIFYTEGTHFQSSAREGSIDAYEVSTTSGLSLRGAVHGRMGYAATEAYDDAAVRQLIDGVLTSAELAEGAEQDEIFAGEAAYPELRQEDTDILGIPPERKVAECLAMDKAAREADPRIVSMQESAILTLRRSLRLKNSFGLDLRHESVLCEAACAVIAKEGESTSTGYKVWAGTQYAPLDAAQVGREAADAALQGLHGAPVASGTWRVILRHDAMRSLLRTFAGVFSAEAAQQKLSLLSGKEGTRIASDVVTLMDDPLLPGGAASCPFDAEGSAARTKAVIDGGVLTTLLHSRKTAKKQGVTTTGNASRGSYASPVRVSRTNFFFQPGEKTLDALMADMGEGLVLTELNGLHSGADPISGDFSLLAKGWRVQAGRRAEPVEQITVAGNFYELLGHIRAVGSDLTFEGGSVGSPSVDVGEMPVSGK